ncbi:MAG: OmpA family protein [Candidatus Kapabacteria bacterium]|nr:OmpA family protein [Candidatus Kapabacteria bacterium]
MPDGTAWVTVMEKTRQRIALARFTQPHRARIEAVWQSTLQHVGMPTGTPSRLFVAGRPAKSHSTDIQLFTGQLRGDTLVLDSALSWGHPPPAWESQPALSSDASLLFFAADYPTGYGGTDIYFAVRQTNGSWAGPYNCGPQINSACNELTPSVSRNGHWLVFASNGHTNVGGYDVFAAPISPAFWEWVRRGMPHLPSDTELVTPWFGEPENLGIPINSDADELAPIAPGTPDSLLYWSSNRAGSFDLYIMQRHEALVTPLSPSPEVEVELRGEVREQETQRPIAAAEVRAHRPGRPTPIARTTTDTAGLYRLRLPALTELELIAQAGEVFFDVRRIVTGTSDTTLPPLELPARLFLRLNFPFDRYDSPYPFVLDSAGEETRLTWQQALDLLAENLLRYREQLQQVTLVGHTDDIGSPGYNHWLGQRRVEFVIEELLRRGVPAELLRGESAGQRQLLPRYEGEALERWRKRCRRVELTKALRNP